MGSRFNLSAWALRNRTLVLFAMIVLAVVGVISYRQLGQSEDPPFTFKAMVVKTNWPGATAEEVSQQVTDRIEKTLMQTGAYEKIVSYSRPGESQVIFEAKDAMASKDVPALFYQIRKKVGDMKSELPEGVQGPFFNDEFGDTYGNIYALTGDGFDYATLKQYADRIELELQRVPDVGKIDLLGAQDEKIWIDLSNTKLASLGLPLQAVQQALEEQNAVQDAGFFETSSDRVRLRVSGRFDSVDSIRNFPIRVGDRDFRIGDVAKVYRGFSDPSAPRMRFMGKDALGIEVAMKPGGDILKLGKNLEETFARVQKELPVGMTLSKVSDQPAAVRASVSEFVDVLTEAVVIVLLVSFFSLGMRAGTVVALTIPLVLAMTFAAMNFFDIGLHKISLGALVLALGLLVDDAIIAVEMMAIKMEQGFDRMRAAAFAWDSTAFPMLTGTLVTAAGFLPIATAKSSTGEYTRSIFEVVTIALILSWIAAVVFIPYLGSLLLPELSDRKHAGAELGIRSRLLSLFRSRGKTKTTGDTRESLASGVDVRSEPPATHHDPYQSAFYVRFRTLVSWCVRFRKTVIAITVATFLASLFLFQYVPQQFFPDSTRLELMVDIKLAEGASLTATTAQANKLEAMLKGHPGLKNYVAYVGTGSPRFYLPLDQQLPATSFAQFVLLTDDIASREEIRKWLIDTFATKFTDVTARVTRLENGPPVGYPVQFRISGEHIDQVRKLALEVAAKVRQNPDVTNVNLDWQEPSKAVRLIVDQDRARALGVSSSQLSGFLRNALSGGHVSYYREGKELIEVLLRGPQDERERLSLLGSLSVPSSNGTNVPLSQIATLEYGFEEGIIWHRNRLPTVTVRADIYGRATAPSVTAQIEPTLAPIRAQLPAGYLLETGGTVEDSARGQASVNAGLPLFIFVVTTLLMIQLRSFSRVAMVWLTAPLGLIGVSLFLVVLRVPFGFVAMLGTIALFGMIMRNSVILVDQIEQDISAGHDQWTAIIDATVRRFRPIVLTALAALLAMIPLSRSVFFGPMAVAIMGGLFVGTALTLLFLPALYAAWFRVKPLA